MSCFRPTLGIPTGEKTVNGKNIFRWCGLPKDGKELPPGAVIVPCGKCIGCRLDYSRRWADRMMLELETNPKAIFVTLTYDDDHLPIRCDDDGVVIGATVLKSDVQDFMKRLRRSYDGKDGHPGPVKIRYFLASEYGPSTLRPHYHAIIYGLSLSDFPDLELRGKNELKQEFFSSEIFRNIWCNGFVSMSDVSWETCAYVARYVVKKASTDYSMCDIGLDDEFCLMSRRPGLGADYLSQHPDALDFDSIPISTAKGCRNIEIPRYYTRLISEEKRDMILEKRKKSADDARRLVFSKTSLLYLDYLRDEERRKADAVRSLGRGKV